LFYKILYWMSNLVLHVQKSDHVGKKRVSEIQTGVQGLGLRANQWGGGGGASQ
jgi:hypothetical protein